MSKTDKVIKIEQTGSPIRRHHSQRETLIGLGLNRIGRVAQLPDTAYAASDERLLDHGNWCRRRNVRGRCRSRCC